MKTIDIKSLLIGTLLTATIFLGIAATSPRASANMRNWDDNQVWRVKQWLLEHPEPTWVGYEPFATDGKIVYYRKRIK